MRPICGATMARGDVCVRNPGHGGYHRTSYALANDRDRHWKGQYRMPKPYDDPVPMTVCSECGHLR